MYGWKYGKGYEGRKIILPLSVKMDKLDTEKKIILAFCEFGRASHFRAGGKKGTANGTIARIQEMRLADKVRAIFETAGWHAHIFQTGSCDCRCDLLCYLHALCGDIRVSEVTFSKQHNITLREEEMFDGENVRLIEDALDRLRKRIGEPTLNLVEMADNYDLDDYTDQTVHLIMEAEGLTEVHEVDADARTFRSGAQEYTWRKNEEEAEKEAREVSISDDELWREAVKAGRTTKSLEDWVQEVIDIDGWAHVLCTYDGDYGTLGDGTVYWRVN
jgi:hypothetical protein